MAEDEMVGWHHWLNGPKFEHTLGESERQGSQVCCSLWCSKESDMTERLSNSNTEVFFKKNCTYDILEM